MNGASSSTGTNQVNLVNSPHGSKLPHNKVDMMNKVESWREARKERLAKRLLALNKNPKLDKSAFTNAVLGMKDRTADQTNDNTTQKKAEPTGKARPNAEAAATLRPPDKNKGTDRQRTTVFERLFQNSKVKTEENSTDAKQDKVVKPKMALLLQRKPKEWKGKSQPIPNIRPPMRKTLIPKKVALINDGQAAGSSSERREVVTDLQRPGTSTNVIDADSFMQGVEEALGNEASGKQRDTILSEEIETRQDVPEARKDAEHNALHQVTQSLQEPLSTCADMEIHMNDIPEAAAAIQNPRKSRDTQKAKDKSLRRSISMVHKKKVGLKDNAVHRTQPEHTVLRELPLPVEVHTPTHHEAPEGRRLSTVHESLDEFHDDSYENNLKRRRSKSVSFATSLKKTPTVGSLRDNLDAWLKARGKNLNEFKHLSCFGVNRVTVTPRRPPRESFRTPDTSMYLTAQSTPWSAEDSDKENTTPLTAIQQVSLEEAAGWLTDLRRLIVDYHYSYEVCDAWMTAIRRQCGGCTQLPLYWECLAVLEESRGDMNSAIEYYERAIIKGAEVDSVMGSLAKLFDKFVQVDPEKMNTKMQKEVDPKNIFTSRIIKFALQQKAVKSLSSTLGIEAKQLHYVVTPVRRSARISATSSTQARPDCFKASLESLDTLAPKMKANLEFQSNASLLPGN